MQKTLASALLASAVSATVFTIPTTDTRWTTSQGGTAAGTCTVELTTAAGTTASDSKIAAKFTIAPTASFSDTSRPTYAACLKAVDGTNWTCFNYLLLKNTTTPANPDLQAKTYVTGTNKFATVAGTNTVSIGTAFAPTTTITIPKTSFTNLGSANDNAKWAMIADGTLKDKEIVTTNELYITGKTLAQLDDWVKLKGNFWAGCALAQGGTVTELVADQSGATPGVLDMTPIITQPAVPTVTVPTWPARWSVPSTDTTLNPGSETKKCSWSLWAEPNLTDTAKMNIYQRATLNFQATLTNASAGQTASCWKDFSTPTTYNCITATVKVDNADATKAKMWWEYRTKTSAGTWDAAVLQASSCDVTNSFGAFASITVAQGTEQGCAGDYGWVVTMNRLTGATANFEFNIDAKSPAVSTTHKQFNDAYTTNTNYAFGCKWTASAWTTSEMKTVTAVNSLSTFASPTAIPRYTRSTTVGAQTCSAKVWSLPGTDAVNQSKFTVEWTLTNTADYSNSNQAAAAMCWQDLSLGTAATTATKWLCMSVDVQGSNPTVRVKSYEAATDTKGDTAIVSAANLKCTITETFGSSWTTLATSSNDLFVSNGCTAYWKVKTTWLDATKKTVVVVAESPDYAAPIARMNERFGADNLTSFACQNSNSGATFSGTPMTFAKLDDNQKVTAPVAVPRFTVHPQNVTLKPAVGSTNDLTCGLKVWTKAGSTAGRSRMVQEWTLVSTKDFAANNLAASAMCWSDFTIPANWRCTQVTLNGTIPRLSWSIFSKTSESKKGLDALLSTVDCATGTTYGAWATYTFTAEREAGVGAGCNTVADVWNWTQTVSQTDKKTIKVVAESPDYTKTEKEIGTALMGTEATSFVCKTAATEATLLPLVAADVKTFKMDDNQLVVVPPAITPRFTIDKSNATLKPASNLTCGLKLWPQQGQTGSTHSQFVAEWTLDFTAAVSATNVGSAAMCWEDFTVAASAPWICVSLELTGTATNANFVLSYSSAADATQGKVAILAANKKCSAITDYGVWASAASGTTTTRGATTAGNQLDCVYSWTDSINVARTQVVAAIRSPEFAKTRADLEKHFATAGKTSFACKASATTAASVLVAEDVKVLQMTDNQAGVVPTTNANYIVNKDAAWKPATGTNSCQVKIWVQVGADASKSKMTTEWTLDYTNAVTDTNLGGAAMCWENFITATNWNCISVELTGTATAPAFVFTTYEAADTDGKRAILPAAKKCTTTTSYGTAWATATKGWRGVGVGTEADCNANNWVWNDSFASPYKTLTVVATSPEYAKTEAELKTKLTTANKTSFVCKFGATAAAAALADTDVKLITPSNVPVPGSAVSILGSALSAAAVVAFALF